MFGAFLNLLDATIVNLALPTIQADLGVSPSMLHWVLVAYLLTFAAGLAPDIRTLIPTPALQGLAGAALAHWAF